MLNKFFISTVLLSLLLPFFVSLPTARAQEIRPIIFPILAGGSYSNDFNIDNPAIRTHHGIDIFAKKYQPLVAATDGIITFTPYPEPSYGYIVTIRDRDNYTYHYIHVNNDNPGTDDGQGGGLNAYAPDILEGNPVARGQHIGWVGDSGNAEKTAAHLHFEIRRPDGTALNPYESLQAAARVFAIAGYPPLPDEILPYGAGFGGGINLAVGNFDGDALPDFATAPASGGGPHVKIYKSDGSLIGEFMAYIPQFRGGVDLAAGDVDGDGLDEIITGAGAGGGPHVKIFKNTGVEVGGFMAYIPQFKGGVQAAAADMDGDGLDEIITGAGAGGGPHIKIFKASGLPLGDGFMAYDPNFSGGVNVAAIGAATAGESKIVTAPRAAGGPHVRVFNLAGQELSGFMAYDPNFAGGVRVSAGNVRRSLAGIEILTVPAHAGGPHVKMFSSEGVLLNDRMEFEPWWIGGYDIEAGDNVYYVSLTSTIPGHPRRSSVRSNDF